MHGRRWLFPALVAIWAVCAALWPLEAGRRLGIVGPRHRASAPQSPWELLIYPPAPRYVGDMLGWEVRSPSRTAKPGEYVQVQVDPPDGPAWEERLAPWGFDRILAARFVDVWDTQYAEPGEHAVVVYFQGEEVLRRAVTLLAPQARPSYERRMQWRVLETDCCRIVYFTHSETQRDLPYLHLMTERSYRRVQEQMGISLYEKVPIVFMPRLWGHGGFKSREIWVSYRDRGPIKDSVSQIVHHEMVHWVESRALPHWMVSMLVEGVAVYLSEGHYLYREPLFARARALLQLGLYLPLPTLARDFYHHQHESAYAQAAALVAYMVQRWGWDAFWDFYTTLKPPQDGEDEVQALDRQLRARFGLSLEDLDRAFRDFLEAYPAPPEEVEHMRLTVALFDTLRAYQRALDPYAYFGTAWLPNLERLEAHPYPADMVRSPNTPLHQTVELLLQQASMAWMVGDSQGAWPFLREAQAVIERAGQGRPVPWNAFPRAYVFRQWVNWAHRCQGEIQVLVLDASPPEALVATEASRPNLEIWPLPASVDLPRATCPQRASWAWPGPWLPAWSPPWWEILWAARP